MSHTSAESGYSLPTHRPRSSEQGVSRQGAVVRVNQTTSNSSKSRFPSPHKRTEHFHFSPGMHVIVASKICSTLLFHLSAKRHCIFILIYIVMKRVSMVLCTIILLDSSVKYFGCPVVSRKAALFAPILFSNDVFSSIVQSLFSLRPTQSSCVSEQREKPFGFDCSVFLNRPIKPFLRFMSGCQIFLLTSPHNLKVQLA